MHAYIHTNSPCMNAYMSTCRHPYMHTYIYIHTHTYRHIRTYTYIYVHIRTHSPIYVHILTYTHIYAHIRTYTYIYRHPCITHTYSFMRNVLLKLWLWQFPPRWRHWSKLGSVGRTADSVGVHGCVLSWRTEPVDLAARYWIGVDSTDIPAVPTNTNGF